MKTIRTVAILANWMNTVALVLFSLSMPLAFAQEVTDSHRDAARAVMKVTGTSDRLDRILPEVAAFTKAGLIANRPDIENEISIIVDEVAISLAARRAPLENEVAAVYTKLFTEDELRTISEFFGNETGIKFLQLTPTLLQQADAAAKVWRAGITRDMAQQVQEQLSEQGLQ